MEQRLKLNSVLNSLVSEFEANFENSNVSNISKEDFFQLISFYEEGHEYTTALEVVKIALEQYKYRSDFYIAMARLLLKINAVKDSLEYLKKAETIAPFENEITILKAKAMGLNGAYDTALDTLDNIKKQAKISDLVEIHLCESELHQEMGNHHEMFDAAKKALSYNGKHQQAHEKFWIATELSRQYIDCITYLNELINQDPYSHLAWFNIGHAHAFSGEYALAIEALEYSFIINPEFENGYLDCADVCCQIKDYEKAIKIYEEAIFVFGEDMDLLLSTAECQMYINKSQESKKNLYKVIKLDPYNDEAFFFLGECYSKDKNWYSAINAYHKAIDLDNEREEYYLHLAKAYIAVEDYNKATVNFNLCISNGPEQTHFWREFSTFLIKLGLYAEAIKILDEAEEFTFGADLLYCRAMANFLNGEKQICLKILEEALLEDFALHTIIYNIAPELEVDQDISNMINYFAGE